MHIKKKIIAFVYLFLPAFFLGLATSCSEDAGGSIVVDDDENTEEVRYPGSNGLNYIFSKNLEGYACYRIPALIRLDEKTLLAFAEGRKNSCSDTGDIDLVVKRSEDNGFTWSNNIIVWDDGGNTCGNPAPIYDKVTGEIVLLSTWNLGTDDIGPIVNGTSTDTRRVFTLASADKGLTWTTAREITSSVKKDTWRWYATGPGSAIQITKGPFKDRLVVGCDFIDNDKKSFSHLIYSDDHGENWSIGGISPEDRTNECEVAQLSNDDLMVNMRNTSPTEKRRKVAISTDGGVTLNYLGLDNALVSPIVQASLHRYSFLGDEIDQNILLFSNPADMNERRNMTIRLSDDDGDTWKGSYRMSAGFAAYSDLENYPDERVAILYEAGDTEQDRYQGISFETVALSEID